MALIVQGRQDWQRTSQNDSEVLVGEITTVHTGTVRYGPFNVVGFESIDGRVQFQSGGWVQLLFEFWHDAGRTQFAGQRIMAFDSAGTNNAQISLRCLGGYMRVSVIPQTGATVWQWTAGLAAGNRRSELLVTPSTGTLANIVGQVFTSGQITVVQDVELYAGPATLFVTSQGVNVQAYVEAEIAAGTWQLIAQLRLMAEPLARQETIRLPPYPCRMTAQNFAAGSLSVAAALIASMTGG